MSRRIDPDYSPEPIDEAWEELVKFALDSAAAEQGYSEPGVVKDEERGELPPF